MGDIGKTKRIIWVEPLPDDLNIPDAVPPTIPVPEFDPAPQEKPLEPARS